MKDIAVITKDARLADKLRLALVGEARVEQLYTEPVSREAYDLLLYDMRGERSAVIFKNDSELGELLGDYDQPQAVDQDTAYYDGYVPIVWRESAVDGMLPYPFRYTELCELVDRVGEVGVRLALLGERTVMLDGERIHLTEIEYKLLARLCLGRGEYVSRSELVRDVWGDGQDEGVLNVYIHYLREKLELGGERIILSSRRNGYRISEGYIGGRDADTN